MPTRKSFWLINAPRRARARKSSTGKKRRPPKGFRTWSAYMNSIRPTSKGGTMARRRRRRSAASPKRRRRRRNPATVALANPRRRRRRRSNPVYAQNRRRRRRSRGIFARTRRRYSRNPRLSVRGIVGQIKEGGMTAIQIVGGKIATRIVRNYIPGGKPAPNVEITPTQLLIELGSAVAVGYLAAMVFGQKIGANVMAGGFVGVTESAIKKYGVGGATVKDALGDDGDPSVITVPSHMAGYVREQVLPALGGYVHDERANGLGELPGAAGLDVDVPEFAGM